MKKHPLIWFYVLAFVLSWMGWAPMVAASQGVSFFQHPAFHFLLILPAVGPALAAFLVQRNALGHARASAWFRSLWRWRANGLWLFVAMILPALLLLADDGIARALGWSASAPMGQTTPAVALSALVVALLSNPWEEVGWRGFALPRLQSRYTAFTATLIVGTLWALWHVPLFFWADNPMSHYPFGVWFVSTVANAFVYTWLFNSTGGSVTAVAVYHVANNTYGPIIGSGSVLSNGIVNVVVAAVVVTVFGVSHLSRNERTRAS